MEDDLDKMVKAALLAPQGPGEALVTVVLDGRPEQVPASVGTYMAVSNLGAAIQQLIIRLDAIHSHLADRDPKRGKDKCLICRAESMTPEQLEQMMAEQIKRNESQEEEEEQVQE